LVVQSLVSACHRIDFEALGISTLRISAPRMLDSALLWDAPPVQGHRRLSKGHEPGVRSTRTLGIGAEDSWIALQGASGRQGRGGGLPPRSLRPAPRHPLRGSAAPQRSDGGGGARRRVRICGSPIPRTLDDALRRALSCATALACACLRLHLSGSPSCTANFFTKSFSNEVLLGLISRGSLGLREPPRSSGPPPFSTAGRPASVRATNPRADGQESVHQAG